MPKTKFAVSAETEAQFVRALVKAAMQFAPSIEVLQTAVARHYFEEQGTPDLMALFKPATPENGPLNSSARLVDLLDGVPRFRSLEKHGINTLRDLSRYSEAELRDLKGVGPFLIGRAKEQLARSSLKLRAD
ncbi:hypothetical protein F6X37_06340 [Paraburkholderia sp. 31.1]|uniref:hypothetical protein n=1 Tax=Paraburkholderia sp. 31.1 TaxID=2615205 RepID=UPI00165601FD|nr:hypothetical protein [Paraburkholderia sp. 31.1]MBC8721229.1 hypothetical protein [Paraburkholderia sp. 31.1]